jgi:hypothetical protein
MRDRTAAPWLLQAALEEATSANLTAMALQRSGEELAGSVFFRSVLLEIVDEQVFSAPGQPPSSGVFHPGETLRIRGFFLQNSPSGVALRLTSLDDDTIIVAGRQACSSRGDP